MARLLVGAKGYRGGGGRGAGDSTFPTHLSLCPSVCGQPCMCVWGRGGGVVVYHCTCFWPTHIAQISVSLNGSYFSVALFTSDYRSSGRNANHTSLLLIYLFDSNEIHELHYILEGNYVSGDSEILNEMVHDTTRIIWYISDFREVSRIGLWY